MDDMDVDDPDCCWAITSATAVESLFAVECNHPCKLSVQQIMDCNQWHMGCLGGSMELALQYIADPGLTFSENYPFMRIQMACKHDKVLYPLHKVAGYVELMTDVIPQALEYQPVIGGFLIDVDHFSSYICGLYEGSIQTDGLGIARHAMLIVGYGYTVDGKLFYIIKNSYGDLWGVNGYAYVLHDAMETETFLIPVGPTLTR